MVVNRLSLRTRDSVAMKREAALARWSRPQEAGLTLVELLIVLAIVGIVLAIGFFNGRGLLEGRQEAAAVNSLRQSVWQGATAASARGRSVQLFLNGRSLEVRDGATVIRRDELPAGVSTNLPQGVVLSFTPPGKVTPASLAAVEAISPYISTGKGVYHLQFSLIGEVRVQGLN